MHGVVLVFPKMCLLRHAPSRYRRAQAAMLMSTADVCKPGSTCSMR